MRATARGLARLVIPSLSACPGPMVPGWPGFHLSHSTTSTMRRVYPGAEVPAGGIDTVLQDQPSVDLAAMADSGDGDDTCLVINGIDDPVVP